MTSDLHLWYDTVLNESEAILGLAVLWHTIFHLTSSNITFSNAVFTKTLSNHFRQLTTVVSKVQISPKSTYSKWQVKIVYRSSIPTLPYAFQIIPFSLQCLIYQYVPCIYGNSQGNTWILRRYEKNPNHSQFRNLMRLNAKRYTI